ncbi:hypothetical protein ACJX0J_018077, partial [Zea mays]
TLELGRLRRLSQYGSNHSNKMHNMFRGRVGNQYMARMLNYVDNEIDPYPSWTRRAAPRDSLVSKGSQMKPLSLLGSTISIEGKCCQIDMLIYMPSRVSLMGWS